MRSNINQRLRRNKTSVIGAGITFATFKPCCEKLKATLKETALSNPHCQDCQDSQGHEEVIIDLQEDAET